MWTKHTQLLSTPPSSCPGEEGQLIYTMTWGGSAAMVKPLLHVLAWEATPSAAPCDKDGVGRGRGSCQRCPPMPVPVQKNDSHIPTTATAVLCVATSHLQGFYAALHVKEGAGILVCR